MNTFVVGEDLSIDRRDKAPISWLSDLCSSLAERLNALSSPREIQNRELFERAAATMLRDINAAQPALLSLQSDPRATSWSGGNLVDLASARLCGIERRLSAIGQVGLMSDAGSGGGVDPTVFASLFKSIAAAYTPALRRLGDAFAAAASKPVRLHWSPIPLARKKIAARLGISVKQLRILEDAGVYTLKKLTPKLHLIWIEGWPAELVEKFRTPNWIQMRPDPSRSG